MHGVPSRLLLLLCTSVLFGMRDFSTHVLLTSYLVLICRPLITFTNFIKSPCHFFSSLSAWLVNRSIPCIFVSLSTIVLLVISTNFRSDETLRTPWGKSDSTVHGEFGGKSDILDCHMGVTWLEVARWLVASRGLMIVFIKILRYAPILAIIGLYSDQIWK